LKCELSREFGNLLQIKDNYSKYVVSMDEFVPKNIQGVEHLHLRKFFIGFKGGKWFSHFEKRFTEIFLRVENSD